jgi:hypothetical protein
MMVAPTEKTDDQIRKAGMKAVNGGNCWKRQLQARVYEESKRSVVEPSSNLTKGYKLVFRTHLGLEITDKGKDCQDLATEAAYLLAPRWIDTL